MAHGSHYNFVGMSAPVRGLSEPDRNEYVHHGHGQHYASKQLQLAVEMRLIQSAAVPSSNEVRQTKMDPKLHSYSLQR